MQEDAKLFYEAVAAIVSRHRKESGIKYTDFCYGNDIPMSTYDTIVSARKQSSCYNVAKVAKALDMSFEEFGRLLDQELPPDFMSKD